MKHDLRSTALALVTSGLVVVGSAACSPQDVFNAPTSADPASTGESTGEADTRTLSGELEFLAPGELIIEDQSFFVAEDTRILGGINACPAEEGADDEGNGTVECDLETLEATLQEGTVVFAEVVTNDDGIAESITEYEQDGGQEPGGGDGGEEGAGGFTGTASGELEYRSPGEYVVDGTSFYVAEDTLITAGIYACADGVQDPDTGNVTCDFDEFDATLANGTVILASVEMVDGIAESITEFQA